MDVAPIFILEDAELAYVVSDIVKVIKVRKVSEFSKKLQICKQPQNA